MRGHSLLARLFVLAGVVAAAGCGGDSPSSPSGGSVRVQGVVLGMGSAAAAGVTASDAIKASGSTVTVTVEGTSATTTVSVNGTFELDGVPGGTFTLVFTKDGVEIGRVAITATGGAEVKITVQVQSTTIIVLELEVDDHDGGDGGTSTSPSACIISGGRVGSSIELEGNVASGNSSSFTMKVDGERSGADVSVLTSGSTSFKCNGGAKLTDAECKASVKAGVKVHVSGQLKTCSSASAQVTAGEVKVQKGSDGGDDD